MKTSLKKLFVAPLAVLALASFVTVPVAEAARGGGGGRGAELRGGGGGGARAGGRQVDNRRADARTNDVRSRSANSVNANRNFNASRNVNVNSSRNVNIDVDNHGCCGGGWDNDYHPIAAAAAITATAAVIGSMVRTVPANCVPVNYGGVVYQQCGGTWYQPQGGQYVVIHPPY
ncbi:MAG: hypothetical protein QM739_10135 [Propionivibrio sp.]